MYEKREIVMWEEKFGELENGEKVVFEKLI